MCPICISAAALATMAGSGSAGGLAALVAVKLRLKHPPEKDGTDRCASSKLDLQSPKAGGGK
jgi:hypothetical protein